MMDNHFNDNKFIPLSVPSIKGNEWKYIKECLDTEWVSTDGKYVAQFENNIAKYCGAKHAVAVVNGSSALHLSLELVGVKPNDEVIVPTLTFIAPVNAVKYLKAEPVFMDCDVFFNIDVDKTNEFLENETFFKNGLTINKKTGRIIRAIIPVHVFGNAVNLEKLIPICKERNIAVIEDATESLGTVYTKGLFKGKHAGTIGDLGCFSFNGNKIITTGGGGMIVTDDIKYAEKAKYLSTQAKDDPIRYIHNEIGYNYRMTNIQAAMGVAQLEKLDEYIRIKSENYYFYKKEIDKIPGLTIADVPDYAKSNYWFYSLVIDKEIYGFDRDWLIEDMNQNGIQVRPIWHLNHLQKPYMKNQNYKIERAMVVAESILNIPCSVNLSKGNMRKIISYLDNKRN